MQNAFTYRYPSQDDENARFFTTLFGGPEDGADIALSEPPMHADMFVEALQCGAIPPPVSLRGRVGADGRLRSKEESIAGRTWRWEYRYDDAGRLVRADLDGATVEAYAYDGLGRRVAQRTRAAGGGKAPCAYDALGRMIRTGEEAYEWNRDGTLHSIHTRRGRTYVRYGADGGLECVLLPDGRELSYAHGPGGVPAAKYADSRLVERWRWRDMLRIDAYEDLERGVRMRFHYGAGRLPVAMTMERGQGPEAFALGYDQVGSLRAVADAAGNLIKLVQYDSFGNVLSDTAPWLYMPIGFAGGAPDRDTGLVRFGRRDYAPPQGRFTAPDPLGYTGRDPDLYEYAVDDPVNVVDPTGEQGEPADKPTRIGNDTWEMRGGRQYKNGRLYEEPGLEEPDIDPIGILASGLSAFAGKGLVSAGKVGINLLAQLGKAALKKTDDMAEAATDQFGKATLKTMDKAYKIENAARKAGTKLDEAGMKAFEKAYDVAKKAGPGAAGLVAHPDKMQQGYDAVSSYLPGGPPAASGSGIGGALIAHNRGKIEKGGKEAIQVLTGAGKQLAKYLREASEKNTMEINSRRTAASRSPLLPKGN